MSPKNYFDEPVAAHYDQDGAEMFAPEVLGPTVDLLASLVADGTALEFAVGTGRVALPLAERGIHVAGIDLSEAMVSRLRAKPGGDAIDVRIGDMASARAPGEFMLVYLVFNTIGNVLTQHGQTEVFRNAARHLVPGGHFLIETALPPIGRMVPGASEVVGTWEDGHVCVDTLEPVTQHLTSHHWVRDGDGWRTASTPHRWVWPSELDLMARLAGLEFVDRWGDWDRGPFTADSAQHVSVWRRPG